MSGIVRLILENQPLSVFQEVLVGVVETGIILLPVVEDGIGIRSLLRGKIVLHTIGGIELQCRKIHGIIVKGEQVI